MKKLPVTLAIALALSGCQLTQQADDLTVADNQATVDIASPAEISQALLVDESIDVIHPVDDVEFSLSDHDAIVSQDIWQHIRSQLSFDIPDNYRIDAQRKWYVSHPNYLDRVAKRAEPFLHYIVSELKQAELPIELALLPVVESAFDPFAYSHGRASGMWQFVPGTGKRFEMKQNWWYDGRRDVIASTQGAIAYLKYLNDYFNGDWLLALAAYNSGEGRVKRAYKQNARKGKGTDFWSLDLPKETRDYVPKLLALIDIVKRPEFYQIKLYEIENKPVIEQIDIGSQIDLAKAAELADISLAELQRLNPGFNRWATAPKGPHYLVIPKNKSEQFKQNLAQLDQNQRLAWQRYKIKNGDSLIKIAHQFHISAELIKKLNNLDSNQIRAGKYLLIPVASVDLDQYVFSAEQRLETKQNRQRAGVKTVYTVQSGDTLWDISRAYHTSSANIAKWNGMSPKDTLKLGQKLVIWQPAKFNLASAQANNIIEKAVIRNITYKVRKGDSLARIANKFNVSIKDIERWNNLNRKHYLKPGQLLKLSVDVTNNI